MAETSKERQQAMQAARESLLQARDSRRWGTNNLNRNRKRTDELVSRLESVRHEPEVADPILTTISEKRCGP